MARPLPLTPPPSTPQAGLVGTAVSLLLCAFALLMCASHSRRRSYWTACYAFFEEDPVIDPVIELNNEVLPSIHGYHQPGEHDTSMMSCEQPVWKKNILMGEKCQLPDFSGVIIYDSEGNVVTPATTQRPLLLTWK